MANVLLLYSTTDGHTEKICRRLQSVIGRHGHTAGVFSLNDEQQVDLGRFDKIVIGASIRYGKHQKQVLDFVARRRAMLESKPSAFFTVNVVARKPGKNRPDNNPYMLKFLQQVTWRPDALGVFAGKINYPKYRCFDRMIIRFIMYITNGPTDLNTVVEFTDWEEVVRFGGVISELEKSGPHSS